METYKEIARRALSAGDKSKRRNYPPYCGASGQPVNGEVVTRVARLGVLTKALHQCAGINAERIAQSQNVEKAHVAEAAFERRHVRRVDACLLREAFL